MHRACLFPMLRAVRQCSTQLITEALEIAQPRSAGNFGFCVPFLVTRLQLLEMLNTLDFKGSAPAVYLREAVLPCNCNKSTVRPLKPGRTVSDQIFQYWLNDLDYSSMIAAHWLTPAVLPLTPCQGEECVGISGGAFMQKRHSCTGPSCQPMHPRSSLHQFFRVTGKAF